MHRQGYELPSFVPTEIQRVCLYVQVFAKMCVTNEPEPDRGPQHPHTCPREGGACISALAPVQRHGNELQEAKKVQNGETLSLQVEGALLDQDLKDTEPRPPQRNSIECTEMDDCPFIERSEPALATSV